jgi:hypothetical protein
MHQKYNTQSSTQNHHRYAHLQSRKIPPTNRELKPWTFSTTRKALVSEQSGLRQRNKILSIHSLQNVPSSKVHPRKWISMTDSLMQANNLCSIAWPNLSATYEPERPHHKSLESHRRPTTTDVALSRYRQMIQANGRVSLYYPNYHREKVAPARPGK